MIDWLNAAYRSPEFSEPAEGDEIVDIGLQHDMLLDQPHQVAKLLAGGVNFGRLSGFVKL